MNIKRLQELKEEITTTKRLVQSFEDVTDHNDNEDKVVYQFLQGAIDSKEYSHRLEGLDKNIQEIICYSPSEFAFALSLLNVSEEHIISALTHELAHYNEAVSHGLPARFCIRLDRSENGRLGLSCGTQTNINLETSLSDAQKRAALRSTIAAPTNLSPRDKRLLV